jgi:hypothetical protein
MRIIDRKWTDLAAGLQAVRAHQAKLVVEFGRAVKTGQKVRFHRELNEWRRRRRVFVALAAFAPLSILTLCLTAFYFHQVACVIVYWALVVLIILVTLAVAGRQYIREVVDGEPEHDGEDGLSVDLEARWWESLLPKELAVVDPKSKKKTEDLPGALARSLPDAYTALPMGESFLLMTGPAGIWLLKEVPWSGRIRKERGTWKRVVVKREKLFRKRVEETPFETSPDEQWLERKQDLAGLLETSLPARAWTAGLIQGGVAFSHPKAVLEKEHIQGNRAAYGPVRAWSERMRLAVPVEGFTPHMQLEILEALSGQRGEEHASASEEAARLYQQAVEELRASVAGMVK